jgi:hypothetical protein
MFPNEFCGITPYHISIQPIFITHINNRRRYMHLSLHFRVQPLHNVLSSLQLGHLLLSPLVERDSTLFHPFHRFLPFSDFATDTHPVLSGLTGQNIGPTVDWFTAESANLAFWGYNLFSFEVTFKDVSGGGRKYMKHVTQAGKKDKNRQPERTGFQRM